MAKNILTTEEVKNKLLLSKASKGLSAWHWGAFNGKPDVLQIIWDMTKDIVEIEELENELLLSTDNYRNTAFHWAAYE
jgi:ankyrin repeat protein